MNNFRRRSFQFTLRRLLISAAVIATLLAGGVALVRVVRHPGSDSGAYELWLAEEVLVNHLAANNGAWPRDWDDLQSTYDRRGEDFPGGTTIERLQEFVDIDFRFDPTFATNSITKDASEPTFEAIWLKNGTSRQYEKPNQRIFNYLKDRKFNGG